MLREMKNLLVGNYFYPLGGSAFVLKALFENMPGWKVEIQGLLMNYALSFLLAHTKMFTRNRRSLLYGKQACMRSLRL